MLNASITVNFLKYLNYEKLFITKIIVNSTQKQIPKQCFKITSKFMNTKYTIPTNQKLLK